MSEHKDHKAQGVEGRPPGRPLAPKWDDKDAFTIEESAEILLISRGSAYAAARSGDIPTVRVGKRLIVPRIGLERMLAGTRAVASPCASAQRGGAS